MRHEDLFRDGRVKIERTLDTLERLALLADDAERFAFMKYGDESVPLIREARRTLACLTASEEAAYEASQANACEPVLNVCIDEHEAARTLLRKLDAALTACERGEPGAGARFARKARAYVLIRREHMRDEDRLFVEAPVAGFGF